MNRFFTLLVCCFFVLSGCSLVRGNEGGQNNNDSGDVEYSIAVFAGGCFWCIEAAFEEYDGVSDAVSGYAGIDEGMPTYQDVSRGKTDYYEAVEVHYDSSIITYSDLLAIFWRQFDPTDDGGSFVDRGTQYRSAIFYRDNHEQMLAISSKNDLENSKMYDSKIVTEIISLDVFYEAEDYHQDYYKKNKAHYKSYRSGSGRDQYREEIWGDDSDYVVPRRLSKEELRDVLTPLQYRVTQEEATERPFDNEYWDNKEEGIYVDVVSGEPLFSSKDKFVSGTGWPSFTKSILEGSVVRDVDIILGFPRTEIRSVEADSHLGHIFEDGPEPSGLRYCINSAALRFVGVDELDKEGLGEFVDDF